MRTQQDRAYLRTLVGRLAQTRTVIERATLAYVVPIICWGGWTGRQPSSALDQSELTKASK